MTSFSSISFSSVSFDVGQEQNPASTPGKRNRWRAWVAGLARGLKDFFKIKQRPPEPEDVPIPTPQSPAGKKVTILAEPPTEENPINISVVASIPSVGISHSPPVEGELVAPSLPIFPYILNPITAPLIQTKVTLPRATRSTSLPPYRVAEGSHIESKAMQMIQPRPPKSKAAAINTLMLLLEIERQV